MATFDVAGDGSVVFATTTITSAAMSIAATANRAALVCVYHSGNSATGISVTLGGVSGTLVSGTDTGTAQTPRTFIFVVINPPSGSQTATCSWTGNNDAYLKAIVYNDCDQTTPAINGTSANGATGAPSLTPTAGAGSASVVCMASGGDAGASQTLFGATLSGTSQDFTGTRGSAGATHSWNNFFTTYVMSGCVLQSPASGPTINTNPQDETSYEGQTATFTVSATTSGGALSYQWKDDGSNVGTNSNSYTTAAATYADNGAQITCEVTDSNGTTVSNPATWTVRMAAKPFYLRA